MPSGWDVYYVVFLSALLALGLPLVLRMISFFMARVSRRPAEVQLEEPQRAAVADGAIPPGLRVNTRFFLGSNAALVLFTMMLALVPCVVVVKGGGVGVVVSRAVMGVVFLSSLASAGLIYAARKGDLNWLRSYRTPDSKTPLDTSLDSSGDSSREKAPE